MNVQCSIIVFSLLCLGAGSSRNQAQHVIAAIDDMKEGEIRKCGDQAEQAPNNVCSKIKGDKPCANYYMFSKEEEYRSGEVIQCQARKFPTRCTDKVGRSKPQKCDIGFHKWTSQCEEWDYSGLTKGTQLQAEYRGKNVAKYLAAKVVWESTDNPFLNAPVRVRWDGAAKYPEYDQWVGGDRIRSKALKVGRLHGGERCKEQSYLIEEVRRQYYDKIKAEVKTCESTDENKIRKDILKAQLTELKWVFGSCHTLLSCVDDMLSFVKSFDVTEETKAHVDIVHDAMLPSFTELLERVHKLDNEKADFCPRPIFSEIPKCDQAALLGLTTAWGDFENFLTANHMVLCKQPE